MKTITILLALFGLLFFAKAAPARVGETEAQVDHRYRKIAGKWDDYIGYKKLYHWHNFDVMVTFVDGVSQREMFNKAIGGLDPKEQKYVAKISDLGKNGIINDVDKATFTTKEFSEKYAAARAAAWAKSEQKQQ